jgi:hypothetical protein
MQSTSENDFDCSARTCAKTLNNSELALFQKMADPDRHRTDNLFQTTEAVTAFLKPDYTKLESGICK